LLVPVRFIIFGEPASKSNSRRLVSMRIKGTSQTRPALIKSQKALDYAKSALKQIPKLPAPMLGPVRVSIKIFYASERPDLDASVILDVLQDAGIYGNDRQVRELHLWHAIDRENPRAVIEVEPIQRDLLVPDAEAA
jgi:Holliday junction resolvase RusA-like endonuclease